MVDPRLAGHDPASDTAVIASLSAAPRIGRLPNVEGDKPARKNFKNYPIGYFHIDIAEVRTEQGKLATVRAVFGLECVVVTDKVSGKPIMLPVGRHNANGSSG